MNTVGQRIKAARCAAGFSQREVAEKFGRDKSTISRWERDELAVDLDDLARLGEFFGVPKAWLAWGSELPPKVAAAIAAGLIVMAGEADEPLTGPDALVAHQGER